MSLAVEVMPTPTLDDLVKIINAEHELTLNSMRSTIEHAVRCGEALLAAEGLCPQGEWTRWLAANVTALSVAQCYHYMRVARHKTEILVDNGPRTIVQALNHLQAIGAQGGTRRYTGRVDVDVDLARRLKADGKSHHQIAQVLGVSAPTVRARIDPTFKQHTSKVKNAARARRAAERAALVKQDRHEAVKRHGGDAAEVYALLRKAAQIADRMIPSAVDHEQRERYKTALQRIHGAEDEIVRALRIGRQS